jgi:hypothetical protein
MTYTTNQLISGAYYSAGVVSREFETVSGFQIADGLGWLNDILTEKRVDEGMIPYETTYTFNAKVGREIYFIPDLIEIDTLVFYLDRVRYAMAYDKRNQYFGMPRVENIKTLPYNWYFERVTGGGNLYIYFLPDRDYPMEIHGIFGLSSVKLGQDLSASVVTADLGVPTFYNNQYIFQTAVPYSQVVLGPGQLIISTIRQTNSFPENPPPVVADNFENAVDLMGTYQNIGALINYINSGILPGVSARLDVDDFVLYSDTEPPHPIYVRSYGYPPNGATFIGSVTAATTSALSATYNNGTLGVGAFLQSTINQFLNVDGGNLQVGNTVLVKDQPITIQNGVYVVTVAGNPGNPWTLTRVTYYDQPSEIGVGTFFTALSGVVNRGVNFIQTADVSLVGTSPILFSVFGAITFSNFSTIGSWNYQVFNAIGFDQFYITYLRYALADRICAEYNYVTPPNVLRQLGKYESWINKKSRLQDLRNMKVSTLNKRTTYGWAFINLGRGWISNS